MPLEKVSAQPCLLEAAPARVSDGQVLGVLAQHYAISGKLEQLGGERDLNFRVMLADGTSRLFKLSHPLENPQVVDFHNQAMLQIERNDPALPVQRVVCLGSPLCGSSVAMGLRQRRFGLALGRSGDLLVRGCALPWPGQAQVGAIAGSAPRGVGRVFGGFPGINDGTVGIEETQWPALADHTVVPASHSGLLLSRPAARQAAHFLRHGRFAATM